MNNQFNYEEYFPMPNPYNIERLFSILDSKLSYNKKLAIDLFSELILLMDDELLEIIVDLEPANNGMVVTTIDVHKVEVSKTIKVSFSFMFDLTMESIDSEGFKTYDSMYIPSQSSVPKSDWIISEHIFVRKFKSIEEIRLCMHDIRDKYYHGSETN
jgi:hypothetical protein